jgi:folate-binding protein YgfZ
MPSTAPGLDEQIAALDDGRAFVDLTMWRKLRVSGSDAASWLNDLLSADLAGLNAGSTRRSLLLSPTGRVRADVGVVARDDGFVLVQDPVQDTPIEKALTPYVLSSAVVLEDVTAALGLLSFPGVTGPPDPAPGPRSRPSVLGGGIDLLPDAGEVAAARAASQEGGLVEATAEALEAWRIRRGRSRAGIDLTEDALPHEAAADALIAQDKGCYLGQEAVARVRNLGHPPFVLLSVTAPTALAPGDQVQAGGAEVGLITSSESRAAAGSAAIVRVRWASRDADLAAPDGTPLTVGGPAVLGA